jgi:hypothetical protein
MTHALLVGGQLGDREKEKKILYQNIVSNLPNNIIFSSKLYNTNKVLKALVLRKFRQQVDLPADANDKALRPPTCTFSKKIVYSRPINYGSKNHCVDLSGPPLGLNDYSLEPSTRG